jgi:hypothetical protein
MNKLVCLFGLIMLMSCAATKKSDTQSAVYFKQADSLLKQKDYFRARDYVTAHQAHFSPLHKNVLGAYIDNVFNRAAASNKQIATVLKEYDDALNDSLKMDLLRIKQLNHVRLYEYTEAHLTINRILENYPALLTFDDIEDYKNTGKLWLMLSGMPEQTLTQSGTTTLKMNRDKAGLANLATKSGTNNIDFIFDTGANISTVTESTAKAFNMSLLGEGIEVGAITGKTVISKIAVCPEFSIGNITIKNAAFLVLPDDALAFPQIGYQINGIIGFPVIEAMKEIQITQNDEFIVPKEKTKFTEQNMALDFLNPVININGEYYTFDSGATNTSLYKKYMAKHASEIEGTYSLTELEFGGAGGSLSKKGYKIVFRPIVAGRQLTINDTDLFTENVGREENLFYGNIGQDVIKQFTKMTLNFESMFIRFD